MIIWARVDSSYPKASQNFEAKSTKLNMQNSNLGNLTAKHSAVQKSNMRPASYGYCVTYFRSKILSE